MQHDHTPEEERKIREAALDETIEGSFPASGTTKRDPLLRDTLRINMGTLEDEVRNRFGVLPNFFRLAPDSPEITANLWGFAKFAYLDNPLPSLFKERLFLYLSRFCEVRYCIARHV